MYDQADIDALLREHPRFVRPQLVKGPHLTFRNVEPDDAEFILSLRLDPEKNRHLSPTAPDLEKQRQWLANYAGIYSIIETDRPVGTVRMYDQRGASFSWGSWILRDHPRTAALESAIMVYEVGLALGFTAAHFDVRKDNERVLSFHDKFGATRVGETDQDVLYRISKGDIIKALERYSVPIEVTW